jgi:hypothetical protein
MIVIRVSGSSIDGIASPTPDGAMSVEGRSTVGLFDTYRANIDTPY